LVKKDYFVRNLSVLKMLKNLRLDHLEDLIKKRQKILIE